jgi:hypothetical protein
MLLHIKVIMMKGILRLMNLQEPWISLMGWIDLSMGISLIIS